MTCYETLFVVKPTLTEEEIAAQIAKVKDVLAKEGAELVGTNEMGMRKLAYQVEKHNRGYYTVLFYKAEGSTIQELERNLKINEDIIKFLTVKYTKNKEIAQFDKLVAEANKELSMLAMTNQPRALHQLAKHKRLAANGCKASVANDTSSVHWTL